MITIYLLTALFILLQAFDTWTTWKILSQGGRELNPRMAWIMNKIGVVPALAITKGLISIGFIYISWKYAVLVWLIALVGINGFYCRLVWNNWKEIK